MFCWYKTIIIINLKKIIKARVACCSGCHMWFRPSSAIFGSGSFSYPRPCSPGCRSPEDSYSRPELQVWRHCLAVETLEFSSRWYHQIIQQIARPENYEFLLAQTPLSVSFHHPLEVQCMDVDLSMSSIPASRRGSVVSSDSFRFSVVNHTADITIYYKVINLLLLLSTKQSNTNTIQKMI